ncbi:hypothetical protein WJX75_002954 [Coccomyxa subellipsoidea]|uniref:FAD-binding domain-containing protein n=1 Tax=Coccomyxa subellipsoidea TaxID=248742 RepID=A0ABR2YM70_9CHLO
MASPFDGISSKDGAIIIGGGFGGAAAAVALHKVGVPCIALEKSRHARSEGFSIGTSTNGWRALDELGIGDELRSEHLSIESFTFCNPSGGVLTNIEFKDCPPPPHRPDHELRVVMREAIPRLLTKQLPPGAVHYDAGVTDVTATPSGKGNLLLYTTFGASFPGTMKHHCQPVIFQRTLDLPRCNTTSRTSDTTCQDGAEVTLEDGRKLQCRFAVLADGVHSKVAAKLHRAKLEFMNDVAWRAITEIDSEELMHPEGVFGQGNGIRIGFFPVKYDAARKKALYYWFFACGDRNDEDFGDPEQQKKTMQRMVKGWTIGPFQQLLEATPPNKMKISKIYQRQVVAGQPWFDGCITGVGDACHATTPFLGQGGAIALESGVELGVFMKEAMQAAGGVPFAKLAPEAICAALRKYETVRSERVALIIKKSAWVGRGIRRSNALAWFVMGALKRFGLLKAFPLNSDTIVDHTFWEPSGSLNDADVPSRPVAEKAQHAEE